MTLFNARRFSALTRPGRLRVHACHPVELKHFDHHRVESSRPQAEHLFLRAEGGQGDDHRCCSTGVHHPQIQKVIGGPRITVPLYKERRGRRGLYGYDDTAFCCRERGGRLIRPLDNARGNKSRKVEDSEKFGRGVHTA
ncbi:hypothetical protein AOLI_G00155460 [Acnodon oligacanthus]